MLGLNEKVNYHFLSSLHLILRNLFYNRLLFLSTYFELSLSEINLINTVSLENLAIEHDLLAEWQPDVYRLNKTSANTVPCGTPVFE